MVECPTRACKRRFASRLRSSPTRHGSSTWSFTCRQIAALDQLPRPTLVTCRTGPRSSALVYLYAGLEVGATADEVLARADAENAPFAASDELRAWVAQGLDELR